MRSYLLGRVSAYRFHIDDPIPFQRSITFDLDHGLHNEMEGDICSVAYWYQQEPHAPFPALPTDRRASFPWTNLAQFGLLGALALLAAVLTIAAAIAAVS